MCRKLEVIMPNFTGCPCKVCQNLFREEDDIVVCPECGTPYHRSCYEANGTCINTALHESGRSWQEINRSRLLDRSCPNCHHINAPDASHCSICRTPLKAAKQQESSAPAVDIRMPGGASMHFDLNDPCCGMPKDEEFDGERLEDVASFVKSNTLYYIPLFKRFKETGKKISLNLPCFLFPHLYFSNRRMWPMTILSVLVLTICRIPSMLVSIQAAFTDKKMINMYKEYGLDVNELYGELLAFIEAHISVIQAMDIVFYAVQLTFCVLMCIFANYLYYRHVIKKVKTTARTSAPQVRQMLLQRDGGTSFWSMLGAVGLYYCAVFAVLAIILMFFM